MMQQLQIPIDNHSIQADLYKAKGRKKGTILFIHGFKGFKDWGIWPMLGHSLSEKGYSFCSFNTTHNGIGEGNPEEFNRLDLFSLNTYTREVKEARTMLAWLLKEEVEEFPLHVIGHSRGGATAILAGASTTTVDKVVTVGAVADYGFNWSKKYIADWKKNGEQIVINGRTGQVMPLNYIIYKDYEENKKELDIVAAAEALGKKLLLIHGVDDKAVPYEQALQLKKANPEVKVELLPGEDHTLGGFHPYTESALPIGWQMALPHMLEHFESK